MSTISSIVHRVALTRVVAQIVEFLELLIVKFDFEGAQAKLKVRFQPLLPKRFFCLNLLSSPMCLQECESVLVSDYFLGSNIPLADFLEAAKLQMFQLYCRLHATASLECVW